MTKRELATRIAKQTKLNAYDVLTVLEAQMTVMKEAMSQGESIYLRGFGTFKLIHRKAKIGQVITRKEAIHIPACQLPKFTPCKSFKNLVNSQTETTE